MEKDFVPYKEALALKELGFDEKCCAIYRDLGDKSKSPYTEFAHVSKKGKMTFLSNSDATWMLTKPTYSQAFRWFRDIRKLDSIIVPSGDSTGKTNGYYYELIFDFSKENFESETYRTYEEAELACLKKLINTIKDGD